MCVDGEQLAASETLASVETKHIYYVGRGGRWGVVGNKRACGYRRDKRARHYRRDRARSRNRIASAWFKIVGEDVPSSVRLETSPGSSPDACRRDAAERLGSVPPPKL